MQIEINEKSVKGFNTQATTILIKHVQDFAEDVIAESYRIEADQNYAGNTPEVTSTMVDTAHEAVRRGAKRRRRNGWHIALRITSALLSIFLGFFLNSETMQDKNLMWVAIILAMLTAISVTATTIID